MPVLAARWISRLSCHHESVPLAACTPAVVVRKSLKSLGVGFAGFELSVEVSEKVGKMKMRGREGRGEERRGGEGRGEKQERAGGGEEEREGAIEVAATLEGRAIPYDIFPSSLVGLDFSNSVLNLVYSSPVFSNLVGLDFSNPRPESRLLFTSFLKHGVGRLKHLCHRERYHYALYHEQSWIASRPTTIRPATWHWFSRIREQQRDSQSDQAWGFSRSMGGIHSWYHRRATDGRGSPYDSIKSNTESIYSGIYR
ncbi:uncharacterized protein MYCFIDRAFT_193467 [Pseudocercospora fijiensis CIRAD86]|uniref:Uncharacterized protein n=1 Tax=Pseudocercospora fijiensis (strain CIRAD86) TaxID=383855 RepID=N1QCN7_PSEFD|nr:uncharacterized protein MYCFIDRAFT_193467 [Pseudocercospora fijiensis CIRAD86]EME89582.1 hypothetical protein MYCFIDRAFT_193467 [Pseudocercospora fijiensis CIRAD86]